MDVEAVTTVSLHRQLDEPFANAQKWIKSREYCLVRVTTSEGVVGWGECWGPVAGNREIVEEYVKPWLIGKRVDDVQEIHDELIFRLQSSYHSYVPASVISGVDIALWDAYGKSVGKPVSRLLASHRRDEVEAYATGHFFRDVHDFEELQEVIVAEARSHVDAGFTSLKQKIGLARHFPWGLDEDIALVESVRDEVGEDIDLMADANHAYTVAEAKRVARALEELEVRFFEEPVPPKIEYYSRLNRETDIPLAAGECWAFQHEFNRALQEGAVDYTQPDVTSAGGITSTHRIATISNSANVQCVPHAFGTPVALAATLQVLATIPGTPRLEFDRMPNPIRDELAVETITNDGDIVHIPDGPGLGIQLDESSFEQFVMDS